MTMEKINYKNHINLVADHLYEFEKECNKKYQQGGKIYNKFYHNNHLQRNTMIEMIDELLDENVIFNEAQFKCFWQSGLIRKWGICSTKEKYISTTQKYIGLYGTPLEKDTIMYKAMTDKEELFGCSWTKNFRSAFNFSLKFGLDKIVSMVIPKGTKTIHINPTFRYKETEDIIDTINVLNETLVEFAKLIDFHFLPQNGEFLGRFEKNNGGIIPYKLDKRDSELLLEMLGNVA